MLKSSKAASYRMPNKLCKQQLQGKEKCGVGWGSMLKSIANALHCTQNTWLQAAPTVAKERAEGRGIMIRGL